MGNPAVPMVGGSRFVEAFSSSPDVVLLLIANFYVITK